jgi:hypothetical protein
VIGKRHTLVLTNFQNTRIIYKSSQCHQQVIITLKKPKLLAIPLYPNGTKGNVEEKTR